MSKFYGNFTSTLIFCIILVIVSPIMAQELGENLEESEAQPVEETLITNVFYDTDIRESLQDVASQAGVSILMDDTVSGFVTLELTDVPFKKALEMILAPEFYLPKNGWILFSQCRNHR